MTGAEGVPSRLIATFLDELEERVASLERSVLAYERDSAPDVRKRWVDEMFRAAHSLKGAAHAVGIASVETLSHDLESRLAPARESGRQLDPETIQALLAAVDTLSEAGRRLRAGRAPSAVAPPAGLTAPSEAAQQGSEVGVATRAVRLRAERLEAIVARTAEATVERRRLSAELAGLEDLGAFVEEWRGEWRAQRATLRGTGPEGAALAMRLDGRLAALATLTVDRAGSARDAARALERVSGALESEVRAARMQPFAEACAGLDRVVRDVALAQDKDVELTIDGGDVALDRAIVGRLRDPLRHLVRNAVDHGVEPRDRRLAAGKPATASVRVGAEVQGESVIVSVSDDGAGFDDDAIRRRAVERGLPAPRDRAELAGAVLTPGFSTRSTVTALSGRGVGLDAVRSVVESIHGSLALSWEPGRGSRCELRVPLSLATMHVVLVRAAGTAFALPAAAVPAVRRGGQDRVATLEGRPALLIEGGAPVPLRSLASTLGLEPAGATERGPLPAVLVDDGARRVALTVDEAVGEREVVITGLGRRLNDLPLISGAAVLENGEIALVLKPTAILRAASEASSSIGEGADRAAPSAARRRILVADDSATTRSLVRSILEGAGYEVAVAVDGADAWAQLQERLPDLVVSDVDMPRMDGIALCESIRRSQRTRDLRVILVTALGSDRDRARGMEAGADAYIVKAQFEQTGLLDTLAGLLP